LCEGYGEKKRPKFGGGMGGGGKGSILIMK